VRGLPVPRPPVPWTAEPAALAARRTTWITQTSNSDGEEPVKYVELGGLEVSRIGLGAMPMSDPLYTGAGGDESESIRTLHRALEMGVNFIDTAEVYGMYTNEEVVSKGMAGRREQAVGRRPVQLRATLLLHVDRRRSTSPRATAPAATASDWTARSPARTARAASPTRTSPSRSSTRSRTPPTSAGASPSATDPRG
jgi:hypothetical protein